MRKDKEQAKEFKGERERERESGKFCTYNFKMVLELKKLIAQIKSGSLRNTSAENSVEQSQRERC